MGTLLLVIYGYDGDRLFDTVGSFALGNEMKFDDAERRIRGFKRGLLKEYFDQCTKEEQEGFYRIFPGGFIAEKDIDSALALLVRTIMTHKEEIEEEF